MAVREVSKDKVTKDGRKWYFYTWLYYPDGTRKMYQSKCFLTKKEATNAEKEFVLKKEKKEINVTEMTFKELYEEFYEYKKDKVKITTLRTYRVNIKELKEFLDLRVMDIQLSHYIAWRKRITNLDLADKTKNGYHKLLKTILNYGTKWHDFNFTTIYTKMEKFQNPNRPPKEMEFYTWEEFKRYIAVIDEIKYKALFETLYYCGLRRGELRGLSWDNINFEYKTLSVVKNVVNMAGDSGFWTITTPKTRTSTRTIPIPQQLVDDLQTYYNEQKRQYGFNDKWFVFGNTNPIHPDVLRKHKNRYADEAGLKHIRLHDFRHSCASVLINSGASIMVVAKFLGHAKIDETLNTYSHLFKNKMDEVVKTMESLE